jgi:hypothetical protein
LLAIGRGGGFDVGMSYGRPLVVIGHERLSGLTGYGNRSGKKWIKPH